MAEVTSFEQLKQYSQGQLVELPSFSEGQPFFARIRRPSLMALVKNGKVPNRLLVTANKLFLEKGFDENDKGFMTDALGIFDVIVEASLVEPTYDDIKKAGLELTDEQLMFIFSYTQQGVRALERFHYTTTTNECISNEQEVLSKAESNS